MSVVISPTGLATTALVADQVSVLASYTEKLCNAVCVNASVQPQYAITYSYGTPYLNGSSTFVPINAVITLTTQCGCNNARTRIFNENFVVAFQGQTTLPTSVTITSVGRTGAPSGVQCCMATKYTINDSLTISIA